MPATTDILAAEHCTQADARPAPGLPPVYYHLHSLLHTLREFERHEQELCGMLGDIQRSGKLTAKLRKELTAVLEELPAASLQAEVDAVWSELDKS
jgi:hypothetical protein